MKTCEDCIHQKVCMLYDVTDYGWEELANGCKFFKGKSKFIEKPFDIGDQIYIVTKYSYNLPYEIIKCTVEKIRLKKGNAVTFSCYGYYENHGYYTSGNFKTSSIGKTVFLTREDAEKRLEELNK